MAVRVIKSAEDYKAAHQHLLGMFQTIEERLDEVLVQTISELLCNTMRKSVARAPVETGDLRKSAGVKLDGVTIAKGKEDGTINILATYTPGHGSQQRHTWTIGYGVDNQDVNNDVDDYAYYQHEHTELNHPNGGEAKFFESAIQEDEPHWRKTIEDEVRKALLEGLK